LIRNAVTDGTILGRPFGALLKGERSMLVVRYLDPNTSIPAYGILDGEFVRAADGDLFAGLTAGREVGRIGGLKLLPPIAPKKIVCVGLNYAAHVTERDPNRKVPSEPVIFMKPTSAVIGPNDPIEIAYPDHETHHEAELVVVIGKRADHVSAADALGHVLGYTCGNDVSDRVLQKQDGQWIRAKGFRTYCPLGPAIQTELDLRNIPVVSRVNSAVRQSRTTASMLWDVPTLVSYVSGIMTLEPGDIIMTGTPEGVGPLVDGDVCEIEIGGIGILRNPVVNASIRPFTAPPARSTT
jgi:2-keto-4-pentenoate hydratase/2-oxohepta-3-ene-1,7-dioic acid hydratase in catechol pathway